MIPLDSLLILLQDACGVDTPILPDTELLDSGLLDSLALIRLLDALEDNGLLLEPTQIEREGLRTPLRIARLLESAERLR